jgi:hypothetical protein
MAYKVLKTRSPFFHQVAATSGNACSLEIRVWNGATKPTDADYTLEANSIDGYATFEVSDIVRGLIAETFSSATDGIYFVELKGYEGATLESTVQLIATEGYALSEEGIRSEGQESDLIGHVNPTSDTRTSRVIISESESSVVTMVKDADSIPTGFVRYRIVEKDGTVGSWTTYSTTTSEVSDVLTTHTLSSTDDYLQWQDSGTNYYVYVDTPQCNYFDNYSLTYVNKLGFKNTIWFNGRTDSKISSSKDNFKTSNVPYSVNVAGTITSNAGRFEQYHNSFDRIKDSRRSYTLNSDFIDEYYVQQFEELFLSEKVWLSSASQSNVPVNIKDSSFSVKNHKNDRLISYTLNVEEANSYINQYR